MKGVEIIDIALVDPVNIFSDGGCQSGLILASVWHLLSVMGEQS